MQLNLDSIFGVIGIVIGLLGIFVAVILWRKSDRQKRLTCQITDSLIIASVIPDKIGHKLSITYECENEPPLNLKGAYITFIRIRNVGHEPIKREDLSSSDPLRIEISKSRVLDIELAELSRSCINFSFEQYSDNGSLTTSQLGFDFLDHFDGALFRILTENPPHIVIRGTIIGMPKGIENNWKERAQRDFFDTVYFLRLLCGGCALLSLMFITSNELSLQALTIVCACTFFFFILPTVFGKYAEYIVKGFWNSPFTLQLPDWFILDDSYRRHRPEKYKNESK